MFNNISSFEKVSYKLNGRDFNGCDCYGLCYLFNKEVLEIDIPAYLNEDVYTKTDISKTYNDKKKDWIKIRKGKEKSGDIISLRINNLPTHVGVIIDSGLMMHIIENRHTMIESYNTNKWNNKIDSFWRYESTK